MTSSTIHPNDRIDNYITAITKDVISFETYADKATAKKDEIIKYCDGKGNYQRTNAENAWEKIITGQHTCSNCTGKGHTMKTFKVDVETIQNVNLGLFEREQPKVGIFSDLSKVEVEMNKQKYTYLYGVRGKDFADADIKTQFQNKDEYKYEIIKPSTVHQIIVLIAVFLDPERWENEGQSIWSADEIRDTLIQNIINLAVIEVFMIENPDVYLEFYDSY